MESRIEIENNSIINISGDKNLNQFCDRERLFLLFIYIFELRNFLNIEHINNSFMCTYMIMFLLQSIVVSKIDENRCKQTLASEFTLILGVQVVPVYSYIEPTTDYCICGEESCFT